ncbi:MAG: glycohydrolase toxin TNT-related protein, partial [Nitrospiraceae bacterium]|nr:glycohydrolase toxin TNT-related protein [Nitrospiraceae bacterium]
TVELAQRGMLLYGVASGVERGIDQMFSGNILQGLLSIGQSAADAYSMTRSCFTGETLVETDRGLRRIDSLKKGDRVLSRSEFDLDGPLEYKTILRTFIRVSPILNLHVNGKIIRTTAEHPFWLKGQGWLAAAFLQPGNQIAGKRPGEWLTVEGVADSGQVETVYNVEVEDHHTYLVAPPDSTSLVWAHNASQYEYDSRTNNYRDTASGRFIAARNLPWPANAGFSSSRIGTLQSGTIIDRYGRPSGFTAGRPGDSVSQRGLPPGSENRSYTQYEVVKPIPNVRIGTAAPVAAFGAAGGGRQYGFTQSIQSLVSSGHLRPI